MFYIHIMHVACRVPGVNVDARIHIDANLKEMSEAPRRAVSALLTKNEFTPSLSLVTAENKTFLETQFLRFYAAKDINGTAYNQLEILAKAYSQGYDYYDVIRRAFIAFITSQNVAGSNSESSGTEEFDILEKCMTPPKGPWTVTLHTTQLSTTEYTPLQLAVTRFVVTVRYIQDCSEMPMKCDGVEHALEE